MSVINVALCSVNHYAGWVNAKIYDSYVVIENLVEGVADARIDLTREEALNLACALPEVKALIEWAIDARFHSFSMGDMDADQELTLRGHEVIKPFEKEEEND